MARDLHASVAAALSAANIAPFFLFEGAFDGSTLRLWDGLGDLSWNSQTWLGNGWFQGWEGAEESIEVEANDMTVVLSGVPSSVISLALGSQVQGATGTLYFGLFDSSGAILGTPYTAWQGQYSHAELEDDPVEPLLRLYYESPLVDIERPNEGRWTHDFQTKLFSGDKGFEYVIQAANWKNTWGQGKKEPKRKNPPRGGRRTGGGRRR